VNLNNHEVRAAYYAIDAGVRSMRRVPPSVEALHRRLVEHVRGLTQPGQEIGTAPTESERVEYVGTRIVAQLLGWSIRTVHRRANDLDGQLVGKSYMFPLPAVLDYAEALKGGTRDE
jgi:hypothetical protein